MPLSNERIKEEFGLDDEVETNEVATGVKPEQDEPTELEQDNQQEVDEKPELDDDEPGEKPKVTGYQDSDEEVERARKQGWRNFDEHVAAGGDPNAWKTARHFNEYGDFVQKIKGLESNFDKRVQSLNLLHQMQLNSVKQQSEELQRQRKDAIVMGDLEQVTALDQRINQNALQQFQLQKEISDSPNAPVPNDPYQRSREQAEMETRFENENPWVAGQDEKAATMRQYFAQVLQQGLPPSQQYELLKQKAQELNTPKANANRGKPSVTDNRQAPRTTNGDISWSDLSDAEKQQWDQFGQLMFTDKNGRPDKKAFLTAVKDARKGV